ncbi:MAG: site-specific DNA-methyltransferase [Chloroflexi bacterium]|nr:site-specific DNA-methyltransferase [Chloroflexota bacterium]
MFCSARVTISQGRKKMTTHKIYFGEARIVLQKYIPDESVQLMVTSPPYWNVRDYGHPSQIGYDDTLTEYLNRLDEVWREVVRVLLPDGKLALNIGNIYYTEPGEKRRTTANITLLAWERLSRFSELRFMGTIYWQKTTSRSGAVLFGSYPYPSNFMISSAIEPIFIFRKAGERVVSPEIKKRSRISKEDFRSFRDALWSVNGAAADKHTAAFPLEIPRRLIMMYSFVEDTVLDPFLGSGTTTKAALDLGRNSIGIEIQPAFFEFMKEKLRLDGQSAALPGRSKATVAVNDISTEEPKVYHV